MGAWRYLPLGDDAAWRASWARSAVHAFRAEPERIEVYLDRLDRDAWCRVLVDENGELLATLARADVGMFVCGGRVDGDSVGFVTVPPEHRGKRASVRLMHEYLAEARGIGAAISVLYSARARLYRGVGYETAGRRCEIALPLRTLNARTLEGADSVTIREMVADDHAEIERVYRGFASENNGYLDRTEWFWKYLLGAYAKAMRPVFVFRRDGEVTGYMVLTREAYIEQEQASEMMIHDLAYTDAETARAMIRFLAGFSSTRTNAIVCGDWAHPLLDHADELWYTARKTSHWLIRLVDLPKAITQRGYNECVAGEVVIGVTDPLIDENAGSWRISVRGGRGSATPTTDEPTVRADITALAPIYTGYMSATQMALNGRVTGDPSSLAVLDGLFASSTPAMSDDF